MTENKKVSLKETKKAHKMLLEEKDVRFFAKIAGFKKGVADKILKENADPGRGATWDPTGTDNRFENLKEASDGAEEVKLEEDIGNTKSLTKPQAPKDSLLKQKGKQDQLKEASRLRKENKGMKNIANTLQKEAFGDNEPEMGGDIGAPDMAPPMDSEPESAPNGLGDVSALVAALAQVIQQHTRCFNRCRRRWRSNGFGSYGTRNG